jgi:hypothetical protein
MAVDPRLKEWATPTQARRIDLVNDLGTQDAAAKAENVHPRAIWQSIKAAETKAALAGYSPNHDMTKPAPETHVVKGTSTLYDENGDIKLQWVKTDLNKVRQQEALRQWVESLADDVKGLAKPIEPPAISHDDLLSVYAIGDPHCGLYAWAAEAGEDFDLSKAESLTTAAVARLVSCSPPSGEALILELGDLLHADDSTNQTPTSHNVLDVDTRYAKVMQVALKTLQAAIKLALAKHAKVTVWLIPGNHDPHSSFAIAMCLNAFYENEKRVTIDMSPAAFKYMQFGKVLIGSHHGHGIKFDQLPGIMAADRAKEWGVSDFRYWYIGHVHHLSRKEFPGVLCETFRTLAARDAWHSGKGYRAGRDMSLIVHHRQYGEIERHRADIAMLENAA